MSYKPATKASNITVSHSGAAVLQQGAVEKANQDIQWADPAPIVYGTALSAAQLNAVLTKGNGALTYTPPLNTVLNAGPHTLRVDAAETAEYKAATKPVHLAVEKADQAIQWADPASIVYGTALSAAQVNASLVRGEGALTYTPPQDTTLDAGQHTLQVDAAETTNYKAANKTVPLTVEKADQTIQWNALTAIVYGTALSATQLSAVLTRGDGALTYASPLDTVLDAGQRVLRVDVAEAANYNAASKTVSLLVEKADQQLQWADPASIVYGTALSAAQLNASLVRGDGALTYTPPLNTTLDAGPHTLQVDAAETTNYKPATKTVPLTVEKAQEVVVWTRRQRTGPATFQNVSLAPPPTQTYSFQSAISSLDTLAIALKLLAINDPVRTHDTQGPITFHKKDNPTAAWQPVNTQQNLPVGTCMIAVIAGETKNYKAHGCSILLHVKDPPSRNDLYQHLGFTGQTNLWMKTGTGFHHGALNSWNGTAVHFSVFKIKHPPAGYYTNPLPLDQFTFAGLCDDLFPPGKNTGFHVTLEANSLQSGLKNPHVYRDAYQTLYPGQGVSMSADEKDKIRKKLGSYLVDEFKELEKTLRGIHKQKYI